MVQPSQDPTTLPLFPLNLVLFPGMPLPLHIFEERYKAMIGECLESQMPFGVVLIRDGLEVGEPAEPFMTGTSARIVRVDHLEDGRMNILTQGESRFQVTEITQNIPHIIGEIQYLVEEPGDPHSAILDEVVEGYSTYLRLSLIHI